MKRIWKKNDGVSPVIATILMVAITVVLAAVLYVMVSGYMQGGGGQPVSGSLSYRTGDSTPSTGKAVFEIALSNPANPVLTDVTVKVFDSTGTQWSNITPTWSHLVSDNTHVKGGDRVTMQLPNNYPATNFEVIISIAGYSGTVSGKVPA
jgi:flagellin-like protein